MNFRKEVVVEGFSGKDEKTLILALTNQVIENDIIDEMKVILHGVLVRLVHKQIEYKSFGEIYEEGDETSLHRN